MQGQIVREYGQRLEVESGDTLYQCFVRKNIDSIVIGDFVEFDWNSATQQGVITGRLPRKNVLCRADRYHPVKEMVANIDQVVVILAPFPKPNEYYLDQYLAAAELIELPAVMLLNKADLLSAAENDHFMAALKKRYTEIGYCVFEVSAKTGAGLTAVQACLNNKVNFLIGASGVGKSSLINALLGHAVTRVQDVSQATLKGQHTTSVSTLYHLPSGGAIIDVPGIRELNLPSAFKASLAKGFREFRPLLQQCRFRNCTHRNDPGCMIIAKVQEGAINADRLKNYYRMLDGF